MTIIDRRSAELRTSTAGRKIKLRQVEGDNAKPRSAGNINSPVPSVAEKAVEPDLDDGQVNEHGDLAPPQIVAADDPPVRAPAIQRELDTWAHAMRLARDDARRLQAITTASKRLVRFGDGSLEPREWMTESALYTYNLDADQVQAALADGVRQGEACAAGPEVFEQPGDPGPTISTEAKAADFQPTAEIVPFNTFDAGDWEGVPIEERHWIVRNRIPAGEPGIMSGDGGTGKTKLMLQLSAAVTAEWPDWVGGIVETHGPVIFYSAEEKLQEMHRRMADILAYRGLSFRDLKGRLRFICDPDDVTLAKADHNGNVTPTLSLLRLEKTVALIRPVLVVIENAADVYAGNENDRGAVTRFVRRELGSLTKPSDAAVGLIQHPSVTGLTDGTGRSGTTGWNNSGRWRTNFTKDKSEEDVGLRQLEVVKSNYGPIGEKVRLRWDRGVFVPEGSSSSVERATAEAPVDETFLRCLDAATAQGRRVSPHPSSAYAPTVFEKMTEVGGLKKKGLEMAMGRLLTAGRIKVWQGPRGTDQIVRAS